MTDHAQSDYQELMKALGSRIKQFRIERGLSLRDMVVKHDYHDSQWRRFERSGTGSLSSLLRIARAFNTSVSILLDGLGEYPAVNLEQLQKRRAAGKRPAVEETVGIGGSEDTSGTVRIPTLRKTDRRGKDEV